MQLDVYCLRVLHADKNQVQEGRSAYTFDVSLHMFLEPLCSVIAVVNESRLSDLRCVLCNVLAMCYFKTSLLSISFQQKQMPSFLMQCKIFCGHSSRCKAHPTDVKLMPQQIGMGRKWHLYGCSPSWPLCHTAHCAELQSSSCVGLHA